MGMALTSTFLTRSRTINSFIAVSFIILCVLGIMGVNYLSSLIELTPTTTGICLSVFATGFLCTQLLSHVLTLDSLLTFLLTLWITISGEEWLKPFLNDIVQKDALHEYLFYHIIAATMVPALIWFLCTDPYDVTMRTALAFSRMMGFGAVGILTLLEQNGYLVGFRPLRYWTGDDGENLKQGPIFCEVGYLCAVLLFGTLAISYAVHLFYNSRVRVITHYGSLNYFMQVDMVMTAIVSIACVLFNNALAATFEQKLDRLHVYLYRCLGLMMSGQVSLLGVAPRLRSVANKRAIFFSKALTCLVMLLLSLYMCRSGSLRDSIGTRLLLSSLAVMALPSALGSMRHDQGGGWDLPWKGLRVPDVKVGGNDHKHERDRSRTRSKSRSRSPKKNKRRSPSSGPRRGKRRR